VSRGRAALVAAALLPLVAGAAFAGDARVDWMLQCQGCHRADGSGSPGVVPDLRGQVARFLLVPGGREYLVQVPGSARSPLGDAALAEVLNWMVRSFGPADVAVRFQAYSADEVAGLRRSPLLEVQSVRRELLRQLGES
jgi:hypothetical protein